MELDGVIQPSPAPRYSDTHTGPPTAPRREGEDGEAILNELGYSSVEIEQMREAGVLL